MNLENTMTDVMHRFAGSCVAAVVAAASLLTVAPLAGAQQGILDDPNRTEAERARDLHSKPLEVYGFLGIEAGMTVGDIVPSAGYNSFVLATVVGPEGKVYAVGTDAAGKQQLEDRFATANLNNVTVLETLAGLPAGAVDAFICVRNVHDMLIPDIAEQYGMQPDPIMTAAFDSLKPGGIFGVVDVRTTLFEGADPDTHRVSEQAVIDLLESHGFEYVDSSELLADPEDDHSQASFGDGSTRYQLDRLLLKFRKPVM